jgi:hypothetical protein
VSLSDRMRRDRRKTSWLTLWAGLILVALLTGCSSGQALRGFSGSSAIEMQGAEHFTPDATHKALQAEVGLMQEGTYTGFHTAGFADNVISGSASDAAGQALEGVNIYIRVVPDNGEVYQTTTDAEGAYSYSVPEGVYLIVAEDEGGTYLNPTTGDGSVTVPPGGVVDFQMPS